MNVSTKSIRVEQDDTRTLYRVDNRHCTLVRRLRGYQFHSDRGRTQRLRDAASKILSVYEHDVRCTTDGLNLPLCLFIFPLVCLISIDSGVVDLAFTNMV